jgi:hypothetical protein
MCRHLVPGAFVTAKDGAAEAQRDAEPPELKAQWTTAFTFKNAVEYYQNRLQQETELLAKAKGPR